MCHLERSVEPQVQKEKRSKGGQAKEVTATKLLLQILSIYLKNHLIHKPQPRVNLAMLSERGRYRSASRQHSPTSPQKGPEPLRSKIQTHREAASHGQTLEWGNRKPQHLVFRNFFRMLSSTFLERE